MKTSRALLFSPLLDSIPIFKAFVLKILIQPIYIFCPVLFIKPSCLFLSYLGGKGGEEGENELWTLAFCPLRLRAHENELCLCASLRWQLTTAWVCLIYSAKEPVYSQQAGNPAVLWPFSSTKMMSNDCDEFRDFFLDRCLKGSSVPPPLGWASIAQRMPGSGDQGHQGPPFSSPMFSSSVESGCSPE